MVLNACRSLRPNHRFSSVGDVGPADDLLPIVAFWTRLIAFLGAIDDRPSQAQRSLNGFVYFSLLILLSQTSVPNWSL